MTPSARRVGEPRAVTVTPGPAGRPETVDRHEVVHDQDVLLLEVAGLVRASAGDAAAPGRVVVGPALATLIGDAVVLTDATPVVSPVPPPGSWAVR